MTFIYTRAAKQVYLQARRDAADFVERLGHSLEEANEYLKGELAYALRLDDAEIERRARETGEGYALVHYALANALAA